MTQKDAKMVVEADEMLEASCKNKINKVKGLSKRITKMLTLHWHVSPMGSKKLLKVNKIRNEGIYCIKILTLSKGNRVS